MKQHENGRMGRPQEEKHGNARGVTYASCDPPEHMARKLVELLERSTHYTSNKTILYGEALKYYRYVSESSLGDFTVTDMEHLSGLLALGAMCQGEISSGVCCGNGRPDAVVFALLESAPVSLDVLLGFLVITPFVGLEQDFTREKQEAFCDCRTTANFDDWKLTPDQDTKDYITAMKGPMMILFYVSCSLKKSNARLDAALFHRIEQHVLFPKLLHRLFRLAARELLGTPDGRDLGVYVRTVLANMADLDGQMDADDHAKEKLLQKHDVTSYQELFEFLQELLPMDIVDRAKKLVLRSRLRYYNNY